MADGLSQQDLAVKSGIWPLYRYNPDRADEGKNPLQLDSKAPSIPVMEYAYNELRYRSLLKSNEERAEKLMKAAQKEIDKRWSLYAQMADMDYSLEEEPA
jgi:pyruvate-ferredoxin/flavodoxin oxidoreductase